MRIGIDARSMYVKLGRGLKSHCYNLITSLKDIDRTNEYFLFYNTSEIDQNTLQLTTNFIPYQFSYLGGNRWFLWEQLGLPAQLRRLKIDVFHATANTVPVLGSQNTVLTLHDTLMFEEDAEHYRGTTGFYIHQIQPILYKRVRKIITCSEYSKKRIMTLFNIEDSKINVIYNGISSYYKPISLDIVESIKRKFNIAGNYIFSIGSSAKRKNVFTLIEGYLDLLKNHKVSEKLVIAGTHDWFKKQCAEYVPDCINNPQVILLPYVSLDELIALYNGATLFVFASIGEGFGLPPLEAMACGAPVIASHYTSLPEVLGDAAHLIDTKKHENIASAILLLISKRGLREEYRSRGFDQVKKFLWSNTALQTLETYKEILPA